MEFLLFSGDYDAVLSRTGQLSDPATMPALIGALALSGRLDEAQSAFRSLSKAPPKPSDIPQARFYIVAGLCHAGNVHKALRLVRTSLADLALPDDRVPFWIWQGLALVRFFEGRFRRARAAGRRALASAMAAAFPYARVLALDLLAHVLIHTGELHAGMRLLEQAASLAEGLGYTDNTLTLRTSATVYRLQYQLAAVDSATEQVMEAVTNPAVSYFTRRNGLIELASAWALRGQSERAQAALEDARKIALPGSDRRGRTRWLGAQALVLALSKGEAAAREVLAEAREAAGDQRTLLAELAFLEAMFLGASDELAASLPALAAVTGIARTAIAAARVTGGDLPSPAQIEDGLCRLVVRCLRSEQRERPRLLLDAGLLGLIPWGLGLPPGRRLMLIDDQLVTENQGVVTVEPAPTGPSLKVLQRLGTGFQSREDLAQHVWGLGQYHPSRHSAVINTAMSRLRPSLGEPSWLVTHDEGYHLASGVELVTVEASVVAKQPSAPPPPPPEEAALLEALREGPAGSAEVAQRLRMSPSSALRLLRRMVERGVVIREGSGRATRYALREE